MARDVFKIFKDLELKAVGLDEKTNKMQEGYFAAFRSVGLPVHTDDYANPYSPAGANLLKDIPKTDPVDPKDAPKTGSSSIDLTRAFAAGVAKSQQSFVNTFSLVNDKLQMSNDYSVMPSAGKVDGCWFAIVNGANGLAAQQELSDDMKKAYADITAKLQDKDGNATPHYEAYLRYRDEYQSKVKARNKAYADALTDPLRLQAWPTNGVPYQDDVEEAWDRWMSLGNKEEIDRAIATLSAQGIDPAIALIARAKKKFQNSLVEINGIGEIPYTYLNPSSWYDADNDDGWTEYTSRDFESEMHYEASTTSYGGGAGINMGLWSGSATFEHGDTKVNSNASVKNLSIKFSYCAVDVYRPWMDTSLLHLQNWFLFGDYKKDCISTGKMAQQLPTNGVESVFLPSVVTSLILVKDVLISWDDWQQQWQEHTESNGGSASVGIYCFTANAHYSHAGVKRDFQCEETSEGLRIPGIQLIGYVSAINPECPMLDSAPYMKK